MNRSRLVNIYNILHEELSEAPSENDELSKIEADIYIDMHNLKEILTQYFVLENTSNKKVFEYAECNMIGLNRYAYTFNNNEELVKAKNFLSKVGSVKEIFLNNEYGLEFKEDEKLVKEEMGEFSQLSLRELEKGFEEEMGLTVTIGDENIEQIQEEIGKVGVDIYNKYYDWYAKNGNYDFYDYIDSFCYGNIDEIKEYLNEVIEYTNKNNISDYKNDILEVQKDIEELSKLQMKRETVQENEEEEVL